MPLGDSARVTSIPLAESDRHFDVGPSVTSVTSMSAQPLQGDLLRRCRPFDHFDQGDGNFDLAVLTSICRWRSFKLTTVTTRMRPRVEYGWNDGIPADTHEWCSGLHNLISAIYGDGVMRRTQVSSRIGTHSVITSSLRTGEWSCSTGGRCIGPCRCMSGHAGACRGMCRAYVKAVGLSITRHHCL